MRDLKQALTDIAAIKEQLARGTEFHGYGPVAFATTGLLAIAIAALQAILIADPMAEIIRYVTLWGGTAVIAAVIMAIEAITRSRRIHCGLADEMIRTAAEQLLPAMVTGALLTFVLLRFAPQSLWMLPGLWQIVLSLGIFAACRVLPASFLAIAVWYLLAGLVCLALSRDNALSPWAMGVPFGVGQLLAAGLIYRIGVRDELL